MSFYHHHVFFCINQREAGRPCCGLANAAVLRDYFKQRVKAMKLVKVRVNTAGCLNRCALGPVIVIYPEAVWYRYATMNDLEEILHEHLVHGRVVERLQLPDSGVN
ncbi:2Fe-2S ferredoxin [Chromatium weissei]|nr:2Fe-2S ferredoxin [Chromatium weissei]